MSESTLPEVSHETPEVEHKFHHYHGNDIPWYVRLMWLGFWVLAIVYTVRWLFPAMREELFNLP